MGCNQCKKKNRTLPKDWENNLSLNAKILLVTMGVLGIVSIYGIYTLLSKLI